MRYTIRADDAQTRLDSILQRQMAARYQIPRGTLCLKKFTALFLQIRPPKGSFPDEVMERHYVFFKNNVILTDANGKPIGENQHLPAGGDPRLLACSMLRRRHRSSTRRSGFDRQIVYPKLGIC